MGNDYDSSADERDQDLKKAKGDLQSAKYNFDKGRDLIEKLNAKGDSDKEPPHGDAKKDTDKAESDSQKELSEPGKDSTDNTISKEDDNLSSPDHKNDVSRQNAGKTKNSEEAEKAATKEGVKEGAKEAGKEAGKEVGKEVAKEAGKEAAKKTATAAMNAAGPVGTAASVAAKAVEKTTEHVKQIGKQTQEAAEKADKAKAKVSGSVKSSSQVNDDTGVKIVIGIIGIIIAVILLIVVFIAAIVNSFRAPVTKLFFYVQYGWQEAGEALGFLKEDTTYEEIAEYEIGLLKDAFTTAFDDVSFDEISQVIEEHPEWDPDLTMESYKSNNFPYILEGETCNVNYMEILSIMSMNEKYDWQNFKHDDFTALFEDKEFLRCLYDMEVVEAEHIIYDEDIYDEDGDLIHQGTGEIIDIIKYGAVTIGKYPLKKLFDYFGVDPDAPNNTFPSMTNYQAMDIISSYTKFESPNSWWGSSLRSSMKRGYSSATGELYLDAENVYADQMHELFDGEDIIRSNDVPVYAQADSNWGGETYGSGTLAGQGCCVTSFAMVASYFTGEYITPLDILTKMKSDYSGQLKRASLSLDYGFEQLVTGAGFSAVEAAAQLEAGKILIVQIPKGTLGHNKGDGHFLVMTGCEITGDTQVFHMADPAGGKTYDWTAQEASEYLWRFWSYGHEKG